MANGQLVGDGLAELARELGIESSYASYTGKPATASVETTVAIIRALGVPLVDLADAAALAVSLRDSRWQTVLPPVLVAWHDNVASVLDVPLRVPAELDGEVTLSLTLEGDTSPHAVSTVRLFELAADGHAWPGGRVHCVRHAQLVVDQVGYHRLEYVISGEVAVRGEVHVLAAPRRAYRHPGPPGLGVFAPTYALRTNAIGGAGDLSTLRTLLTDVANQGGTLVGTLPLLAAFLGDPCEPSPYAPASRLAWNELYLDLERAATQLGSAGTDARELLASPSIANERARLFAEPYIDYRAQYAWRRRVIDELAGAAWQHGPIASKLTVFAERPEVLGYAVFRAIGEALHLPWRAWPAAAVAAVRADNPRQAAAAFVDDAVVQTHLYAQWAMDAQLADLTSECDAGLYLDLPVGVGSDAYDVLAWPEQFVDGVSTGAPPDGLFVGGQDWGLPPLHPEHARKNGWRYFADIVRHHMQHARVLRIDHVMGLHRLYWVPRGRPATDGAYVRYPDNELWAVLCLESHRNACELVGEDLGTVPPQVPIAMSQHGVRGLAVRQFSLPTLVGARPAIIASESVASLGTHDTPTFAGYFRGDDLEIMVELGLLKPEAASDARRKRALSLRATEAELARAGLLPTYDLSNPAALEAALMLGLYRQLAQSGARDVLVTLEDLWLEAAPQNVPGTSHERPNWCRPLRCTDEQREHALSVLHELAALRPKS